MGFRILSAEHVLLNRTLKMSSAALRYLYEDCQSDNTNTLRELFQLFPYWNQPPIADFTENDYDLFCGEMGRMAIVRAMSSFDAFITGLEAELERDDARKKKLGETTEIVKATVEDKVVGVDDADKPPRFETFLQRRQLCPTFPPAINQLAQVFNLIRNCCAHRAGHTSQALANILAADLTKEALKSYPSRGDWQPSLPAPLEGEVIQVQPYHAILSSDVFLRIARIIDRCMVERLGPDGLVSSAVHHAISQTVPELRTDAFWDAPAAVNFTLSLMRVADISEEATIKAMRSAGVWEKALTKLGRKE